MPASPRPNKNNKNKGNDMTWSVELNQKMDAALSRITAREARARLERELERAAEEFEASIYAKRSSSHEPAAASTPAH